MGAERFSQALGTIISRAEAGEDIAADFYSYDAWDEYLDSQTRVSIVNFTSTATSAGIEVDAIAYTGHPELVLYRFSTVDADGTETVVQDWGESPHLSLPLEGHGTITIKVDTTIVNISYTGNDRSYQHTVRY